MKVILAITYNYFNNTHEKILDSDWLRAVQFKCSLLFKHLLTKLTVKYDCYGDTIGIAILLHFWSKQGLNYG